MIVHNASFGRRARLAVCDRCGTPLIACRESSIDAMEPLLGALLVSREFRFQLRNAIFRGPKLI